MGCGFTIGKNVKGKATPEILQVVCIHGDLKQCLTKKEQIKQLGHGFRGMVGEIPTLFCPVLLGRDCLLLPTILRNGTRGRGPYTVLCQVGKEPSHPGFALRARRAGWLQRQDETLKHA